MANILGKYRDVLETITIVKGLLKSAGFDLEEKELIHQVENIWSVNLQDKDSPFYTNGKGSTKENCLASAYCEFLERLGTGFFFFDYALDHLSEEGWLYSPDEVRVPNDNNYKNSLLNKKLWKFYDPNNVLESNAFLDSGLCNKESIISLPFTHNKGGVVNFPVELLRNIYASNGLSAGNSEVETLVQGVSEAIERGVKNYIISEGLSLPDIDRNYLVENDFIDTINEIESFGFSVKVKDASLKGRFPVICVLLINLENGSVLSSFGSHPIVNVAIDRSLTELLQGRKLESFEGFSSLSNNYDQVADEANLESHFINSSGILHYNIVKPINEEFTLWQYDKNTSDLDFLNSVLKKEGYEYFYRTKQIGDMWVSQTIIPHLSEIYPVEDLEYEYKNSVGYIRSFLKRDLDNDILLENIEWFNCSYISGDTRIVEYLGISTDEEHILHSLLADEVELLLYIQQKNVDKIKYILNYQIDLSLVDKRRLGFWSGLNLAILDNDFDTLSVLYTKEIIKDIEMAINGVIPRRLFPLILDDYSDLDKHKKISGVYKKYRKLLL